jgi:hypothetical protein
MLYEFFENEWRCQNLIFAPKLQIYSKNHADHWIKATLFEIIYAFQFVCWLQTKKAQFNKFCVVANMDNLKITGNYDVSYLINRSFGKSIWVLTFYHHPLLWTIFFVDTSAKLLNRGFFEFQKPFSIFNLQIHSIFNPCKSAEARIDGTFVHCLWYLDSPARLWSWVRRPCPGRLTIHVDRVQQAQPLALAAGCHGCSTPWRAKPDWNPMKVT